MTYAINGMAALAAFAGALCLSHCVVNSGGLMMALQMGTLCLW